MTAHDRYFKGKRFFGDFHESANAKERLTNSLFPLCSLEIRTIAVCPTKARGKNSHSKNLKQPQGELHQKAAFL